MPDELIDIYDKNNEPLGISKMKSEAHEKGLWHRAAHIWVYNSKGETLLQLRSKELEYYPDAWVAAASGHIGAGENIELAATRELSEEIGIEIKPNELEFFKVIIRQTVWNKIINNEYYYVYLYKFDGDITKLKLQEDEVQRVKFFSIDKLNKELKIHPENYLIDPVYWRKVSVEIKKRT